MSESTGSNDGPGGATGDTRLSDAGANAKSPDLKKWRDRRERLHGRRRALFDRLFVPAEIPELYTEPVEELAQSLAGGGDPGRVLSEAQAYFANAADRIDSAERRATTLQGAVAIATPLVLAGAGLLLDSSKVPDRGWRIVLILCLAAFVVSFLACALRALAATTRVFEFLQPGWERIPVRAAERPERADLLRAAELLRAGAVASEIGDVKVGLLRAAAWWMRVGMLILTLMAGLLVVLAATGPAPRRMETTTKTLPAHIPARTAPKRASTP